VLLHYIPPLGSIKKWSVNFLWYCIQKNVLITCGANHQGDKLKLCALDYVEQLTPSLANLGGITSPLFRIKRLISTKVLKYKSESMSL